MRKLLKISELTFDKDLYPRMRDQWQTAWRYAQAMKSGSEFSRILVGSFKGKLYIVDGLHRVNAKKLLKEEYIEAEVKKYTDMQTMFVDAVKANIVHGRQLTYPERARIIHKLEEMKFGLERISEIVKIPIERIERVKARTIIGPNGKLVFVKGVVAKISADDENILKLDMGTFNVESVNQLLNQLIELVENNVFPLDNEKTKELTVQLYGLLQDKLQLVTTS